MRRQRPRFKNELRPLKEPRLSGDVITLNLPKAVSLFASEGGVNHILGFGRGPNETCRRRHS